MEGTWFLSCLASPPPPPPPLPLFPQDAVVTLLLSGFYPSPFLVLLQASTLQHHLQCLASDRLYFAQAGLYFSTFLQAVLLLLSSDLLLFFLVHPHFPHCLPSPCLPTYLQRDPFLVDLSATPCCPPGQPGWLQHPLCWLQDPPGCRQRLLCLRCQQSRL